MITSTGVARLLHRCRRCCRAPASGAPEACVAGRRTRRADASSSIPPTPGGCWWSSASADVGLWRVSDPSASARRASDRRARSTRAFCPPARGRHRWRRRPECAAFCSTARRCGRRPRSTPDRSAASPSALTAIASAGEDGVVRLWTFAGTPAGTLDTGGGMVLAVAFAPNGDRLVAETCRYPPADCGGATGRTASTTRR